MQMVLGAFYLSGAFMLAGTSVIAARLVAGDMGTFTIAGVSLFFATITLLPFCWQRLIETLRQMPLREWIPFMLQALFGIFLFRMFLLLGLMHTSAGEAGILTGVTPAATALMAVLWLKEPLYLTRTLGLISTVTGIIMIQGALIFGSGFSMGHFGGNLMVIGAALCESLFNILSRIGSIKAAKSQERVYDPMVQTTLVAGIAMLFCLGPALAEHPLSSLELLSTVEWLALVWYGVFVTALAFILWYAGIKRCEASTAAAFTGLMPFTSLLLSVTLLGEQPDWQQWAGGVLVITGMLLTGLRRQHSPINCRKV